MELLAGAMGGPNVQITFPSPSDDLFQAVFRLGESEKEWLGVLPHAAWADYAESGHIMALVDPTDGGLLAYCAYRLPRNDIVIAHLVVAPSARGRGAARRLVEELSQRHASRRGIKASCRRDYPANRMWPSLGFVPIGERPGRGSEGRPLTTWWRDHGHVDLLSWQGPPSAVTSVVLDSNVFIDLHSELANRRSSVQDWLGQVEDRVQLLVTPELLVEIDRREDAMGRVTLRRQAESYPALAVDIKRLADFQASLESAMSTPPRRVQDVSDVRHVAYAAAAGVPVVLTRDDSAMRRLAVPAEQELGVRILNPQELVTYLDEQERSETYWPAALMGTGYSLKEATTDELSVLEGFHDHASGERKKDYVHRLRRLAGGRPGSHRRIYYDPRGAPIALVGSIPSDEALEVCVLRLRPFALQSTLAAQIVHGLRALAWEHGRSVLVVTEPHLHPLLVEALMSDGYKRRSDAWAAVTMRSIMSIEEAGDACVTALEAAGVSLPRPLDGDAQSLQDWCVGVEHMTRPNRIVDAPIDSLLVPIRAAFASALFGYPADLFGRTDELGISIEHVYFRGGRSGETPPARILWYVSGRAHGAVFALSDLLEVVDDSPKALYARYRRYGVYTFAQVTTSANRAGQARALRFTNTELLSHPVPLDRLRRMAHDHGHPLTLRSPHRLPKAMFEAILREGRRD